MSHFGRLKGKRDPAFSLRPLIPPLGRAIGGRHVAFAEDCIGAEAKRVVEALRPGQVALLENLRFHKGEEANSPDFARALADLGDVYVDDAFSAAHRAHASIDALARLLPSAAGKLMQAELTALTAALEKPTRPVLAMIGGAKVSSKLDLLRFLIGKIDILVVAGAMANTFLFAEGREIGRSLCERNMADNARKILVLARQRNCRVVLPQDAVAAAALEPGVTLRTVGIGAMPKEMMILDIGPETVTHITAVLEAARTLVWNGPLGAFETAPFDRGTVAVAKKIGELTRAGKLLSVAGGGDTIAALDAARVTNELSYLYGGRRVPRMAGRSRAARGRSPCRGGYRNEVRTAALLLAAADQPKHRVFNLHGSNLHRSLLASPDCRPAQDRCSSKYGSGRHELLPCQKKVTLIKLTKYAVAPSGCLLSSRPWVELESTSVMAGIGGGGLERPGSFRQQRWRSDGAAPSSRSMRSCRTGALHHSSSVLRTLWIVLDDLDRSYTSWRLLNERYWCAVRADEGEAGRENGRTTGAHLGPQL